MMLQELSNDISDRDEVKDPRYHFTVLVAYNVLGTKVGEV